MNLLARGIMKKRNYTTFINIDLTFLFFTIFPFDILNNQTNQIGVSSEWINLHYYCFITCRTTSIGYTYKSYQMTASNRHRIIFCIILCCKVNSDFSELLYAGSETRNLKQVSLSIVKEKMEVGLQKHLVYNTLVPETRPSCIYLVLVIGYLLSLLSRGKIHDTSDLIIIFLSSFRINVSMAFKLNASFAFAIPILAVLYFLSICGDVQTLVILLTSPLLSLHDMDFMLYSYALSISCSLIICKSDW